MFRFRFRLSWTSISILGLSHSSDNRGKRRISTRGLLRADGRGHCCDGRQSGGDTRRDLPAVVAGMHMVGIRQRAAAQLGIRANRGDFRRVSRHHSIRAHQLHHGGDHRLKLGSKTLEG